MIFQKDAPSNRRKYPHSYAASIILFGILACFQLFILKEGPYFSSVHQDWNDIRLPPFITAASYRLNFTTDLNYKQDFGGIVHITLNITETTKVIAVHAVELDMVFESLTSLSGHKKTYTLLKREAKPLLEYTLFTFTLPIQSGIYVLKISYKGLLSNNLAGYYLSTYHLSSDPEGSNGHHIATTQFEPTDARRAFPCLDEPAQKATFEIAMTVQDDYHALSNMPVKEKRQVAVGWTEFQFQKSVRMSTYLVAFIVSDFVSISSRTKSGVKVSVWTAPSKSALGEYALNVSVPILEFYENTFGIEFPLPKLDMIAIPDFSAGAMENWGLVTYRDTALLFDPKTSTAYNKQRVATVIGHELAHQWFGNLVTMSWWTDLWLNEGFAEFMEYKAVASVEKNWDMLSQFIPLDLIRCLHADESYYTHQIAVEVKNPSEISSIFDDISYGKGSSILRMLESWMDDKYGVGTFFRKLHDYLDANKYGNADTSMLWESLRMPDQNFGKFMGTWTNQPGFPLLTFNLLSSKSFLVSQERFIFANLVNLSESSLINKQQSWSVPVSYSVYSNISGNPRSFSKGFTELSTLGNVTINFDKEIPNESILIANYLQTGVYRSLYEENTYRYLIEWLDKDLDLFPAVERGGFLSDVFSMTFAGHLKDPTIALDLCKLLAKETNILVWNTAIKDLESLKNVFALDPLYGKIVEFQAGLEEAVIDSIGWKEIDPLHEKAHGRALLRGTLLSEAVRNNHVATVEMALKYFEDIKNGNPPNLSTDVFPAIYNAGVIYGDLEDYSFVMEKFKKSTFAPEQIMLLHALASSKAPYLQAKTLSFAISGKVRKQDIQSVIAGVVNLSPIGHISAWVFVMDNWEKLLQIFEGNGFGHFNDLLKDIVSSFTKQYLIDEAERLFVKQTDPDFFVPPGARIAVLKGLETAKQLLAWRNLYSSQIEVWLDEHLG